MQGQRDGRPLVLLDTAVVVGIEIGHVAVLIDRVGLEIETGAVDVGGGDGHAVGDGTGTDDGEQQRLAAVVGVHLVARLEGLGAVKGDKALRLGQLDGLGDGLALGLGSAEEGGVSGAVGIGGGDLLFGDGTGGRAGLIAQLLLQKFDFGFF